MSAADYLRYCYLTMFSQPAVDRPLYKAIYQRPLRSIVELGIGSGVRTQRLFELAVHDEHKTGEPLRYTGIDPFESRSGGTPGLTLKQAFKQLRTDGVRINLVPGDPYSALERAANSLTGTDLLIISADQTGPALDQAWRFLPRMIHAQTLIFMERPTKKAGVTQFEPIAPATLLQRATVVRQQLRRAA